MKVIDKKIIYEIGDYIFVKKDAHKIESHIAYTPSMHKYLGATVLVTIARTDDDFLRVNDPEGGRWLFDPRWVRPATQEEIDKMEEPLIVGDGSHNVVIKGTNLFVGCQKIEKEQFLRIGKKMEWI